MEHPQPRHRGVATSAVAVGLGAAAIAGLAQLDVDPGAGLVPFSLQTFGVVLCGLLLGPWRGLCAVALYLLVGALGAPVFAEGAGGATHLAGPTGGYLVGFLGCAWVSGRLRGGGHAGRRVAWGTLAGCAGHAVIFAVGVPWLAVATGLSAADAVAAGMTPFLPGAGVKSVGAALVAALVRRRG